ncbi:Neutral/alkaline non-lysosomal ceramidase, C-terminal [Streptomyces wuyuanensis]|uniref:Neutral/alkaline non-lysosomal ceramidase, C-terminal n=1 Tax=Streptomyces wuyuanensis TaxID=1196353 RepID=A0A1G9YZF5_9ACTN|nr:Neutral/alkaline non-lysosomal ceramidase, C-terminal [Streptomyces wuyuanensis]
MRVPVPREVLPGQREPFAYRLRPQTGARPRGLPRRDRPVDNGATNSFTGTSKATVTRDIDAGTPPGTYRVVHVGDARSLLGRGTPFTGTSRSFTVR